MGNKTKQQNQNAIVSHHIQQLFSGPIPSPEILAKYENLQAGLAERIIRMAEEQAHHRQILEAKSLQTNIEHVQESDKEARYGQNYAFIVAMTAIVGGLTLAFFDKQIAATIITSLGLGGIITAFIYGRTKEEH
ncbi:MAG TPA: DUF2335 domain-containing protein [Coxiellaceae bacterium]|nr:DUF2335 domain-containing protein [Coxiellaceae bacterium]